LTKRFRAYGLKPFDRLVGKAGASGVIKFGRDPDAIEVALSCKAPSLTRNVASVSPRGDQFSAITTR
jgi:hypothetical protein